jgi:hypothetical protein
MKKRILEGFKEDKSPDMKYYAFDWDDNIVHMPTKIILKDSDGDEVGMSTDDFAKYRHDIGKEDFDYNGQTIVGFAENPFRNFGTLGDKDFLIDAMRAKEGPAFEDFKEAYFFESPLLCSGHRSFDKNKIAQQRNVIFLAQSIA